MKSLTIISIAAGLTVFTIYAIQYLRVRRWRADQGGYYRGADALYGLA